MNNFQDLIKDYIEDSLDFLDDIDNLFLDIESADDRNVRVEGMTEILSQLHTFKGNSGMMGFGSVQSFAHSLEDLLKVIQHKIISHDDEATTFARFCFSSIRNSLENVDPEAPDFGDLQTKINEIEQFIENEINNEVEDDMFKPISDSPSQIKSYRTSNILKVNFMRLDNLLNLMGELVIYRTRLGQIDAQMKEEFGERRLVLELSDTFEHISKVSTELYEAIMKVRMLPLQQVFSRFPRFIRSLAKDMKKDIVISFEGEKTELDKRIIDEIGEPLMHILRNAVDHGIESPEVRSSKGKPRQGEIIIRAHQESSHIIISIEDDGRGLDLEKLKEKAKQLGFLDKEDIQRNVTDLIFLHGISTASRVTETSGRGIGMDVVRKSLTKINGTIDVESEVNVFTRFTIKLPLTLAIISALMVDVSRDQYAIPLSSIIESIKIKKSDVHEVNHCHVVKNRGYVLPLVNVKTFFKYPDVHNIDEFYVVIVQGSSRRVGLIVDSLLGRQEIVIKPLDHLFGFYHGIAGASILGDGSVVMIVDINAFTESSVLRNTDNLKVEDIAK